MSDAQIGALDQWVRGRYLDNIRPSLAGLTEAERAESLRIAFAEAAAMSAFSQKGSELMATPEGLAQLIVATCVETSTKRPPSHESVYPLLFDPANHAFIRQAFSEMNPLPNPTSRRERPASAAAKSRFRKKKSTRR